jgi:small multidrug resistance pump
MPSLVQLFLAIASEVLASSALKASQGFSQPVFIGAVVIGYGMALYFMSLSLQTIPLSIAYAIWSGVGTLGTTMIGVFLFRERLSPGSLLGIVMIVAGVIILNQFVESAP